MATGTDNSNAGRGSRRAGRDLAAGLLLLLAAAAAGWRLLDLSSVYLLYAVASYAVLAALILVHAPPARPGPGLGAANRVTLGRGTLVLAVAALALQPAAIGDAASWWIIALSTVGMVLDGLDGWLARRTGTTAAFGARFDMEMDALLILALSALVWRTGRTGPWVLLIGALRYLFLAGGWTWPWLAAPLPPSRRRQVLCVVQGVALLVCLGPIVPAPLVPAIASAALALLIYSFAVDIRWLVRRAG